jgi:hypothetical protein
MTPGRISKFLKDKFFDINLKKYLRFFIFIEDVHTWRQPDNLPEHSGKFQREFVFDIINFKKYLLNVSFMYFFFIFIEMTGNASIILSLTWRSE